MPAFRSVVDVLLRDLGDFSLLSSRPALRAASGRPPARQPHESHWGLASPSGRAGARSRHIVPRVLLTGRGRCPWRLTKRLNQ